MDDWNDFGAPPPDPSLNGSAEGDSSSSSSFPSVRTSHSAPQGSSRWSQHSSGAAEPRSVMFRGRAPPSTPFRDPSHLTAANGHPSDAAPNHTDLGADDPGTPGWHSNTPREATGLTSDQDMESGSNHARRFDEADVSVNTYGDLDTIGDFEEVGTSRSKRSTQSSSTRFHRHSYTKLEVISAQQIEELLHCFHVLIAVAVSWTIFTLICSNAMFAEVSDVPLRLDMLNSVQKREAKQVLDIFRMSVGTNHSAAPALFGEDLRFSNEQPLFAASLTSVRTETPILEPEYSFELCELRRQGTYLVFNELVRGPKLTCQDVTDPCYVYWKSKCDAKLSLSARQATPSEEITVDFNNNFLYSLPLRIERQDVWYSWLIHTIHVTGGVTLLALGTLFLIRLVRVGRVNMSQEQMFACGLLFIGFVYFNVPLAVLSIGNVASNKVSKFPQWFNQLNTPIRVIRDICVAPTMILYLWLSINSYRILDPQQKLGIPFYLPKILLLTPYAVLRICAFFIANITLSEMSFISAIVVQHSFGRFQFWRAFRKQVIFIIIITVYEAVLLLITIAETAKTMKVLRRAPYMKHRSKHTGFRFFIYINFAFYVTFFLLQVLLVVARPSGSTVAVLMVSKQDLFAYVNWTHTIGTTLLTFGYIIISAYVNLPYDSVGAVKGWFTGTDLAPSSSRWSTSSGDMSTVSGYTSLSNSAAGSHSYGLSRGGTHSVLHLSSRGGGERSNTRSQQKPSFIVDKDYELNQEIVEPVTYRKLEKTDAMELRANCFTMQTHVIMFNFAWYVYYYGTPKFERFERAVGKEDVLPFGFSVADSIMEEETDTHALVISGTDRIIVAFKGSTSMRNLKTAIQAYHERLHNVVPTDLDNTNTSELQRLKQIFGRSYEAAKIHKGFARAYASVAHRVMRGIKRLIDEKARPVFLTGHSLGGALATICSLDVWIKLRISRRQIFVSTFGSPRVGNEAFRRIYNSVIALHWRIVVDPDMITKLPKVGYRHVGKKVVLTAHGLMFIDPSQLELKLWSGSTAGFAYHRKASYLVAMKAWCMRNHRLSYTPAFWPFPVHQEDYQRFAGAQVENEPSVDEHVEAHGQRIARKIILLDAMVDKLDNGSFTNTAAVEKWARLTRRLLLRHKLSGAVGNSFP